jgi:hypothetical protein
MKALYFTSVCGIAALALACASASALTRTTFGEGRAAVSGGVGDLEQSTLKKERGKYSLWAITAARGSGAYLSDARVQINDRHGRMVYTGTLDGPWLMMDLPPGRYTVEAIFQDQVQRKTTTIGSGQDRKQMIFHFDAPAERLSDVQASTRPR